MHLVYAQHNTIDQAHNLLEGGARTIPRPCKLRSRQSKNTACGHSEHLNVSNDRTTNESVFYGNLERNEEGRQSIVPPGR